MKTGGRFIIGVCLAAVDNPGMSNTTQTNAARTTEQQFKADLLKSIDDQIAALTNVDTIPAFSDCITIGQLKTEIAKWRALRLKVQDQTSSEVWDDASDDAKRSFIYG